MSLYGNYIRERENMGIVESDKGFATYCFYDNGECYLKDLYVTPEFRKTHVATEMADEVCRIAMDANCHTLLGSVDVNDKNVTRNLKIFLGYGMEVYKTVGTLIFLRKGLTNG
jgi:ribosomal protein S18 acetylase RimI-like enzyme